MKLEVEDVTIAGGYWVSTKIDLSSRRLKGVLLPQDWDTAKVTFKVGSPVGSDPTYPTQDLVDASGTRIQLASSAGGVLFVIDPDDLEGLNWIALQSGTSLLPVPQGDPAVFGVTPSTADFSSGDPVTFTVSVIDSVDGRIDFDVVLDADYVDVGGLSAELASQASGLDWTTNVGVLIGSYSGNIASSVDVTNIVDPDDLMGFSSYTFPVGAVDTVVTLLTEPRT